MEYTKNDLRKIAQQALESEYGFKPALTDVVLLESSGDGTYILFSVKNHEYRFSSYHPNNLGGSGCVWVDPGTVEKIS